MIKERESVRHKAGVVGLKRLYSRFSQWFTSFPSSQIPTFLTMRRWAGSTRTDSNQVKAISRHWMLHKVQWKGDLAWLFPHKKCVLQDVMEHYPIRELISLISFGKQFQLNAALYCKLSALFVQGCGTQILDLQSRRS